VALSFSPPKCTEEVGGKRKESGPWSTSYSARPTLVTSVRLLLQGWKRARPRHTHATGLTAHCTHRVRLLSKGVTFFLLHSPRYLPASPYLFQTSIRRPIGVHSESTGRDGDNERVWKKSWSHSTPGQHYYQVYTRCTSTAHRAIKNFSTRGAWRRLEERGRRGGSAEKILTLVNFVLCSSDQLLTSV